MTVKSDSKWSRRSNLQKTQNFWRKRIRWTAAFIAVVVKVGKARFWPWPCFLKKNESVIQVFANHVLNTMKEFRKKYYSYFHISTILSRITNNVERCCFDFLKNLVLGSTAPKMHTILKLFCKNPIQIKFSSSVI